MNKTTPSTFLFADPSFTEGMARVLDMAGLLDAYNSCSSEKQADFLAMLADWQTVGQDLGIVELLESDRLLNE